MLKISKNVKNTEKVAQDFLLKILKQDLSTSRKGRASIVGLYGDLGTGKTTFTQAVAKYLGIKGKVNSPTFVIIKKYFIKSANHKFLFHIDAYRLKNAKEIINLGWKEIISNPEHLVFIEWPEKVSKAMPKNHHKVIISHTKEGYRNFEIKYK